MPPSTQIIQQVSHGINGHDDDFDLPPLDSELLNFYRGANIFLTGATGFMGKMVLEKVLRTCPGVGNIYVLIRPKKGQQPEQRAQALFDDVVFERLLEERPKVRHQVVAVAGDCSLPGLGLSDVDRKKLVDNVNIILHCAATVRFDEVLDVAVNINVRGTRCIIDLAKETKHIKAVMQVSTAYANCIRERIDETLYDMPLDSDRVTQIVNAADQTLLERIAPTLIGSWPNSYAYTKALGENVVKLHHGKLPIGIFRPAIVISTCSEPVKGWIDNLYGPGGVVLGAGLGLLHTLNADANKVADLVPVDLAVNSLLAATWETATMTAEEREARGGVSVYNYVSSVENPLTWGKFMELTSYHGNSTPPASAVWMYSLTLCKSKAMHMLLTALLHFLPALFVDAVCIAIGSPFRLMKVYKKIYRFSDVLAYFATRQWRFSNDHVQALWRRLGEKDRELFPFSMTDLDWESYYSSYVLGMRTFMFKEDPKTIPYGLVKRRRLYWAHQLLKAVVSVLLLRAAWWLLSLLGFGWTTTGEPLIATPQLTLVEAALR